MPGEGGAAGRAAPERALPAPDLPHQRPVGSWKPPRCAGRQALAHPLPLRGGQDTCRPAVSFPRPMLRTRYRPPKARGPLVGRLGGATRHGRGDCAGRNRRGGALPLPGPHPTKGLRPLETSNLALRWGDGALGRGAIPGMCASAPSPAARRHKSAVQGPAGPWRGGLEGQRPTKPRAAGAMLLHPSVNRPACGTAPS
jgi:hypothetical protein